MTDTYGMPPHDSEHGHDEVLTPEHEAVHEAPSDYEFADEHAVASEEHHEEHADVTDVPTSAKRSVLLPIVAAAGGMLVLGVVAWWQFSGSGSTPMASSQMPSLTPPPPAMVSNIPAPEPIAQVAPKVAAAPVITSIEAPAPVAVPAPVVPTPTQIVEKTVQQAPVPTPTPAVEIKPVPAVVAAESAKPAEDQHVAELNARIDSLQKQLEQANQQLTQMANMVAANAPAGVHVDAEPAKPAHKVAVKHVVRVRKKAVKTLAPVVSKPVVVDTAPNWVLRSAAPGQAWVTTGATGHDFKEVHVGDTLAGIGKVTAIRQQGMGWIVEGTKGQIQ